MKKAIFFVTRYSLLYKKRTTVSIAKDSNDLQEYRDKLMSKERLENRLSLFSQICLPSIAAQAPCKAELHHIIVTSDQLSEEHTIKLRELTSHAEKNSPVKFHIIAADSGLDKKVNSLECYADFSTAVKKKLRNLMQEECVFATVRLDDDDALGSTFSKILSKRLHHSNSSTAVTFPLGYQAEFNAKTQALSNVKELLYPKIALGLSFINFYDGRNFYDKKAHVYQIGGHTKVDLFYPTLADSSAHMYLRIISSYNDSGDITYHDFLPEAYKDCHDINNFTNIPIENSVNRVGWNRLSKEDFITHMRLANKGIAERTAKKHLNKLS